MTLLPLHLVVNWPVFTILSVLKAYILSPSFMLLTYLCIYLLLTSTGNVLVLVVMPVSLTDGQLFKHGVGEYAC